MYSATNTDRALTCSDCGQQFTFTASEQEFYAARSFSEPRRCPTCRAARKASRGDSSYGSSYASSGSSYGDYGRSERQMYSATCSSCGREAKVPFRPNGMKPVYCNDCFATHRR